jgi:hypothetical protein
MRGQSSRLAAVALALLLGAAGAHSLGVTPPAGAASCFMAADDRGRVADPGHAASNHVQRSSPFAAAGLTSRTAAGGWKGAESERTGAGSNGHVRGCPLRPARSFDEARHATTRAVPAGITAPISRGLLGLATSPANAPPGS